MLDGVSLIVSIFENSNVRVQQTIDYLTLSGPSRINLMGLSAEWTTGLANLTNWFTGFMWGICVHSEAKLTFVDDYRTFQCSGGPYCDNCPLTTCLISCEWN